MHPTPTPPFPRIAILGYGNLGQALSPLLRGWLPHSRIVASDRIMDDSMLEAAADFKIGTRKIEILKSNYAQELSWLGAGDLALNLATSIGSPDLMEHCAQLGIHYLDTGIDPWQYHDGASGSSNSNHALREMAKSVQAKQRASGAKFATALAAHGANPGMASVLAKLAVLEMKRDFAPELPDPLTQIQWARLARELGIACIQISEVDHQTTDFSPPLGCFANTWSVDGFLAEALQPCEIGWGSHEAGGPMESAALRHGFGAPTSVHLPLMGHQAFAQSWSPRAGPFQGRVISHNEPLSICEFFSIPETPGESAYSPTCLYAYRACAAAQAGFSLIAGNDRRLVQSSIVLKDEITAGSDELGALIISSKHPSLWLGSDLTTQAARTIAPRNNATSLQVAGSMLAALKFIARNPELGLLESEELDPHEILRDALPYWQPMQSQYRAWHPKGDLSEDASWRIDQFLCDPTPFDLLLPREP